MTNRCSHCKRSIFKNWVGTWLHRHSMNTQCQPWVKTSPYATPEAA